MKDNCRRLIQKICARANPNKPTVTPTASNILTTRREDCGSDECSQEHVIVNIAGSAVAVDQQPIAGMLSANDVSRYDGGL